MDGGFSPFHSRKRPEWHKEPIRSHRQTDTLLTALALEPGATSRYKRHWGSRATSQHYYPPDGSPEHYAASETEMRRYSRCYTASCPNTWSHTHTSQSRAAQRNKERGPAHSCHLHKKVSDCCQWTKQPARNVLNGTWSKKTLDLQATLFYPLISNTNNPSSSVTLSCYRCYLHQGMWHRDWLLLGSLWPAQPPTLRRCWLYPGGSH